MEEKSARACSRKESECEEDENNTKAGPEKEESEEKFKISSSPPSLQKKRKRKRKIDDLMPAEVKEEAVLSSLFSEKHLNFFKHFFSFLVWQRVCCSHWGT